MKQDFPLKGPTEKVTVELEANVVQIIKAMEQETKNSFSEMTNTAIKRFISSHKDFLPVGYKKPRHNV